MMRPRGASLESVDENVGLMLSSWLTSAATSRLRAACRFCKVVFPRHCPCTSVEGGFVYFEALEKPQLDWMSLGLKPEYLPSRDLRCDRGLASSLARDMGRNRFSPLLVFRLDLQDAGRLLYFRPERRMAKRLFRDKSFCLAVVRRLGRALVFAAANLRQDRDVVLAAVASDGVALRYAHDQPKRDRAVVMATVNQNGWALGFADETFRSDRAVVLAAVASNGYALMFADATFKRDKDVVLTAVRQHGYALFWVDETLRSDQDVVSAAVAQNSDALDHTHQMISLHAFLAQADAL